MADTQPPITHHTLDATHLKPAVMRLLSHVCSAPKWKPAYPGTGTGRVGGADFPNEPAGHSFVVDPITIDPAEVAPPPFAAALLQDACGHGCVRDPTAVRSRRGGRDARPSGPAPIG
jgi:hypothetical protein